MTEFWGGVILIGVFGALLATVASGAALAWALAAALALFGLYVWEYIWVHAGQSVPLS
jgi:hypothetical protein